MGKFATGSDVPVSRSRDHLEKVLHAHGAQGFGYGWTHTHDRVEFVWRGQRVRFTLPRPTREQFAHTPSGRTRSRERAIDTALDAETRRRWRALLLVVRAKLEAVESGIAIFEEEFLAFIVMPNDRTVGEILVPQLHDGTIGRKLLPASPAPAVTGNGS
jgi:hypothetical protein